jgi:hypothetical protein
MQLVTDRFQRACRESGERITVADLYYNKQKIPIATDLGVISGSLTFDSTAAQRRSGSITLASSDLISLNAQRTIEPYGLEIGLRSGVKYADGDLEFCNLGIYVITEISWSEAAGGIATCTLMDRSNWLAEQASKTGVEDYSAKSTFFAINDLLTKGVFINCTQVPAKVDPVTLPPDTIDLVVDTANLTDITIPGGSPMDGGSFWDDIMTLAASLGAEIFFDVDGTNVILRKVPDLDATNTNDDAVLIIDTGDAGTLVDSTQGLSRAGAYNAVQMTGALAANATDTATPPTVFVYDSDPSSVTFYDITGGTNSGFGRIVFATTSDTITDKTALTTAATVLLKQGLGLTKTLSVTMLPNPALEPGDIVLVKHLDGTEDLVLVTVIDFDLAAAAMTLTTVCRNQITAINGGTGVTPGGGGGVIPIPPGGSITKTYACTWSQSYTAGGSSTSGGSSTFAYQGDDGLGDGNRKSLLGFDYATIQADTLGHVIVSCTLTIKYLHWWYSSGGTAIFGTHHSTTSSPSTYPSTSVNRLSSPSWATNATKTINLGTDIGTEFQNGTTTGIAVGPGPTGKRIYYAYAAGFGHSSPPVLTITYM